MSYLPGVPDMGPAPANTTVGKQTATEHLGSVVGRTGKGMTSVGGGDPLAHSLNHYGKPAAAGAMAGSKQVRGLNSTARHGVRAGGLGPGRMGTPGPSDTNYSNTSQDTE